MTAPFNVAVSCNERYVPGALVALAGVAVHAQPETRIVFHVFTEEVRQSSLEFMRSTLTRLHENCELVQHVCDEAILKGLPYWAGSRMALVRCFYSRLMPDVNWCLYLDCDILYLANVEEHFSFVDENVYACVVKEESERTRREECRWIYEHCGVSVQEDDYFNSGVMLLNLEKMRQAGKDVEIARCISDHPDCPLADQTALNVTLAGYVRMLPPKFNRLQIFIDDVKMAERPVVHYVSGNPWLPKYGEVASYRFRLWHAFADKHIWQKKGESCRRLFARKMLTIKYICYWALKCPMGIGRVFAWLMWRVGLVINAKSWRDLQVAHDCTQKSIDKILALQ